MALFIVPLSNDLNARTETFLSGARWVFIQTFNQQTNAWYLSISSAELGVSLESKKMVTGEDFLTQHGYRGAGSMYVVDELGENADPTRDEFSSDGRFKLIYNDLQDG